MSYETYREKGEEFQEEEAEELTTMPTALSARPAKSRSTEKGRKLVKKSQVELKEDKSLKPYIVKVSLPSCKEVEAIELCEMSTSAPKSTSRLTILRIPLSAISPRPLRDLTFMEIKESLPTSLDPHELVNVVIKSWPKLRFKEPSELIIEDFHKVPPGPLNTPIEMIELFKKKLLVKFTRKLIRIISPIHIQHFIDRVPRAVRVAELRQVPEEERREKVVLAKTKGIPKPSSWEESPMTGILEEAFDIRMEGKRIGLDILMDRSFVILAEKPMNKRYEYIEFLKLILRELYRVRSRGLPSPRHLTIGFEGERLRAKASGYIYVIDVDKVLERTEQEFSEYIRDRLKELFSQSYGFLIFYWSKSLPADITLLPGLINIRPIEHDALFNLASLMWGIVGPDWPGWPDASLDSHAIVREHEFYDSLIRIANSLRAALLVKPSLEPEEGMFEVGESLTHYAIKAFVVRYFMEKEKVPVDHIETECALAENVIVDVLVEHPSRGRIIVEVETLYGTGLPLTKLVKTIESRMGLPGIDELWIIVPNPQAVLFLKQILALINYCNENLPVPVKFYVLNIKKGELVPITDLKRIIDDIRRSIELG